MAIYDPRIDMIFGMDPYMSYISSHTKNHIYPRNINGQNKILFERNSNPERRYEAFILLMPALSLFVFIKVLITN